MGNYWHEGAYFMRPVLSGAIGASGRLVVGT
jgi:hypothetical protein